MTKELLLPHSFKKIGWVILIPTLLLGVLMLIDGFNGYPTYLMPAQGTACYETLCSTTTGRALNNIALVGICIGGIFVACSRERIEDEMISRIRLNALLTALYVNYALLIATALCTYDLSFLLRHDLQPAHHAADIPRGIPLETVAPETRGRR